MQDRLVIVGGGLAGSLLAAELADTFDVTVVELRQKNGPLALTLTDINRPAGLFPHAGSGPGGTTALWNNGLIELEDDDYGRWPLSRQTLTPYLSRAYPLLSGVSREAVETCYDDLRGLHTSRGIPRELIGKSLFYPHRRRNLWQSLCLAQKRVRVLTGRARNLVIQNQRVTGIRLEDDAGGSDNIPADHVILSAGGLSTPLLVQETARQTSLPSFDAAGRHYIDHPMGMVAKIKLNTRLYDIWNYRQQSIAGTLQTPLVVRDGDGLKVSVFLRPSSVVSHGDRRDRVQSVLANIRNTPFKLSALAELASSADDIRELISFKLGLQLPTDYYVLRLVASEIPTGHRSIYLDAETGGIARDWCITNQYVERLDALLQQLIEKLGGTVIEKRFFDQWGQTLHTAAHHSGTCRMSTSSDSGVCNSSCQIFDLANAYICDGSVLPATGYANTGLTIAALALRLSDHLKQQVSTVNTSSPAH
jgi:hypothetical protein